jgi:hypothetical protein
MNRLPPEYYDENIKELYSDRGKTMKQVADILDISVGKVFKRLKIMGVKSKKLSDYPTSQKKIESNRRTASKIKGKRRSKEFCEKQSEVQFKGGVGFKKKRSDGYVCIHFPEHPRATKDGMIMEHILVMECFLGRPLKEDEVVHHKNHKRDDNRLCNLQIMTEREHMSYHMTLRQRDEKGRIM